MRLSSVRIKILLNSPCQFWNDKSIPLQIMHHSSLLWHITPLWILSSYVFYFGLKDPIKVPILCQFKSVFLQILHHPSVSWKITPLYFFRSNIKYFAHAQYGLIKVQILETFEYSGQISPNSCHFWKNRSVFLQILRQSSRSWDITPLYFLAKILYTLRSLSKYKFGEILREQSKVWNFALWWAPFVQIMYSFS